MVSTREQRRGEKRRERLPTMSPRKRPLILDESDEESDADNQLESPCKRLRRIVLDDDEEEDEDKVTSSTTSEGRGEFDEDHEALLTYIEASQSASSKSLPHLPAETLLTILEFVSPADILDYRLVCKSFKHAIDTHVMYHHIQSAELIGFLGRKQDQLFQQVKAKDYWDLAFLRAKLHTLDEQEAGQAKWDPEGATFQLNDEWSQAFSRVGGEFDSDDVWWDHTKRCLDLTETPFTYGQLRWCVKVAGVVLDFGIEDEQDVDIEFIAADGIDGDDIGSGLTFRVTDWKVMLRNFFREERALKLEMQASINDEYTYSHQEDCLRQMRRRKFRSRLDPKDRNDSRLIWKMDNMIPLWGRHSYVSVNVDYDDVERAERTAVQTLVLLRKEAAMLRWEREALELIITEREIMRKEMEEVDVLFKQWQENLLSLPYLSLERIPLGDDDLDPNPVTWTRDVIDRQRRILVKWKGQRNTIKQLTAFLDTTNTIAALVDDGFASESDGEF